MPYHLRENHSFQFSLRKGDAGSRRGRTNAHVKRAAVVVSVKCGGISVILFKRKRGKKAGVVDSHAIKQTTDDFIAIVKSTGNRL